jgi:phosphoribosylanthranilate isomerase
MNPSFLIKVCGISTIRSAEAVCASLPDFIGFIFSTTSLRNAEDLIPTQLSSLPPVRRIGVFVDAPVSEIQGEVERYKLSGIQLHGNEDANFCSHLRHALPGRIIIKAFRVGPAFSFTQTQPFSELVDYFLFDAPLNQRRSKQFEWKRLAEYQGPRPFFLAGGISIADTQEIAHLRTLHPYLAGVDISSALETSPGVKCPHRVREFITTVRTAIE